MLNRRTALRALSVLLVATACGGSEATSPTSSGQSTISATIDGVAWTSVSAAASYLSGVLNVVGEDFTSLLSVHVPISAPGTVSISFNPATPNAWGDFSTDASKSGSWTTSVAGGTGSVTVTTLTATRAVGTFAFEGTPFGGTTGVKHVTSGKFDVAILSK